MMQDMMYRGRSPYMGINSMNRFGMQGQQQAQQSLGGGFRTADMQDGNGDGVDDRDQNQNMQQPRPNYPMYGGGGLGGMYGGRMGGMYGGGGYGAGMGSMYGGRMGGMYGGGMYGGGMMGMPPMPRPSPYGGGLTSGFGGQMFGANPYQYSQGLGSMGQNFQMNRFPQTGLYNLMAMQQGSFDPYMQYQTDDTDSGGGNGGGGDNGNGNGDSPTQQYGQQQQYGGFGGYGYGGGYGGLGSMGNYGGGFSPYGGMPTYPQQTPYGRFSY